jgi:hypothetical protein
VVDRAGRGPAAAATRFAVLDGLDGRYALVGEQEFRRVTVRQYERL